LGGEDLKVLKRREGRGVYDLGGNLEERKRELLGDRVNIMIFEEVKRERIRGGRKSERRRLIKTKYKGVQEDYCVQRNMRGERNRTICCSKVNLRNNDIVRRNFDKNRRKRKDPG